jgi:hypothetical protein
MREAPQRFQWIRSWSFDLINPSIHRGVGPPEAGANRFNGFAAARTIPEAHETVETVRGSSSCRVSPLKRGVHETSSLSENGIH